MQKLAGVTQGQRDVVPYLSRVFELFPRNWMRLCVSTVGGCYEMQPHSDYLEKDEMIA